MSKTTTADNWYHVVPEDDTGSLICVEFTCPHCGFGDSTMFTTSQTGLSSFTIDVTCEICGGDVTVDCT